MAFSDSLIALAVKLPERKNCDAIMSSSPILIIFVDAFEAVVLESHSLQSISFM